MLLVQASGVMGDVGDIFRPDLTLGGRKFVNQPVMELWRKTLSFAVRASHP